ncbi:hypothetical protein AAFF_G00027430 [Aldrovandia affinis]|uniref:Uncharacterized protein n=1 Tax=Aldrovandia affinis TaxID=143900 RepID=A0AAD7S4J1_9TELE|nr:hypothetical protein AAFF_G00027430 [Aldrovandia affinis]
MDLPSHSLSRLALTPHAVGLIFGRVGGVRPRYSPSFHVTYMEESLPQNPSSPAPTPPAHTPQMSGLIAIGRVVA